MNASKGAEKPSSDRKSRVKIRTGHLRIILTIASIAMPGFFAIRHVATWQARASYAGDLDNVESCVLAEMVHLRQGIPIYAPASSERFDTSNYGPLFYLLGSQLINSSRPAYLLLRVVSLFATIGLAAACGLLAFWITRNPFAVVIASLLFLSYTVVTQFGSQARSDAMALLLWFSGFLLAYRFQNCRKILLAIPMMTLGFYYKQQFVVGPLSVILFLLIEKRFRLAAEFTALLGIAGVSLFAILQFLVFRHQDLFLHFLKYNMIPFSWHLAFSWGLVLTFVFLVPCLVAVQFLQEHQNKLLACYLIWGIILLVVLISKQGSNLNYAIELLLVLCPLFASQLMMSFTLPSRAAAMLVLLAITLWCGNIFPIWVPKPVDIARENAIQAYLTGNFPPGAPALGYYTGGLVRAGLDTPISDLYQYSWLACKGVVPYQILLDPIRKRRYAVILLRFPLSAKGNNKESSGLCLDPQFYSAIMENYRPVTGSIATVFEARRYYGWIPRE